MRNVRCLACAFLLFSAAWEVHVIDAEGKVALRGGLGPVVFYPVDQGSVWRAG